MQSPQVWLWLTLLVPIDFLFSRRGRQPGTHGTSEYTCATQVACLERAGLKLSLLCFWQQEL